MQRSCGVVRPGLPPSPVPARATGKWIAQAILLKLQVLLLIKAD